MRYLITIALIGAALGAAIVGIAGFRGEMSRNTPIEIFPDMNRQAKLRPQQPDKFFPNGISSQLPPAGTVAEAKPLKVGDTLVYPYEDSPVYTGRAAGTIWVTSGCTAIGHGIGRTPMNELPRWIWRSA